MQQRFPIEDFGYLLLTMLAAAICAWLLGAVLTRLDIPGVDTLLRWTPLAVAFTIFAVSGVTNAINIIDGYNGVAGGYALMVLAALPGSQHRVRLRTGQGVKNGRTCADNFRCSTGNAHCK